MIKDKFNRELEAKQLLYNIHSQTERKKEQRQSQKILENLCFLDKLEITSATPIFKALKQENQDKLFNYRRLIEFQKRFSNFLQQSPDFKNDLQAEKTIFPKVKQHITVTNKEIDSFITKDIYNQNACPNCEHTRLITRKTLTPKYKCFNCKTEFDKPIIIRMLQTFKRKFDNIDLQDLKIKVKDILFNKKRKKEQIICLGLSSAKSLFKQYKNLHFCANSYFTNDYKATSKHHYCKNKFCVICNNIKTAKYINNIKRLQDKIGFENKDFKFLTLTKADEDYKDLDKTLQRDEQIFKNIIKELSRQKFNNDIITAIETTFNPITRTAHLHYHILARPETAEFIKKEWLKLT